MNRCVHLLSGGLDSTVMLYDFLKLGWDVRCIGFDYGQTHYRELESAKLITRRLGLTYEIIQLARVFGGSSLLGEHSSVVVPNRNMVFLSVAAAMAESDGRQWVTYGCTREDWETFPDCRLDFIEAVNLTLKRAELKVRVRTPYANTTKRELVGIGRKLKVPFKETWSCYIGGEKPCGQCDACLKRKAAMQ